MHPVKAVPTRCNPFVHGEEPKKTYSSIKPIKTQKNPLGWAFLKKPGFFKPWGHAPQSSTEGIFLRKKSALLGLFSLPEVFCRPQICQNALVIPGPHWGSSRRLPKPPSRLAMTTPPQSPPLWAPLAPRFSHLRRSASVAPNVKSWLRP